MLIDSAALRSGEISGVDVLVVGSGPVGLALGTALERLGHSVLIVESGVEYRDADAENDLNVTSIGEALPGLTVGRTRQVGGGLNLWGGQLALLEDEDLRRTGADERMKWPISRTELYSGLVDVLCLIGAAEVDLVNKPSVGEFHNLGVDRYGLQIFRTAWLKTPKLDRRFWAKLKQSRATKLIYGMTCTGIRYDSNRCEVAGIVAANRAGERFELGAAATVLAAGAVENARLLLLPTVEGCLAPWRSYSWLGRGFSEHIDANTAQVEILDQRKISDTFDPFVYRGIKYSPKIAWAEMERGRGRSAACGFLFLPQNIRNGISDLISVARALLVHRQFESLPRLPQAVIAACKQVLPLAYRYAVQHRIGSFLDRKAYLRVSTEQPVRLESAITLSSKEVDRVGMFRAVINWTRGEQELASLKDFTLAIKRWLEGEGIAKVHVDPRLTRGDVSFLAASDDGLHHAGTTRMGRSEADSVVDTDLRVHNVKNLYVCGASVFPSSGYANPTLTGMALAHRLAAKLSVELRQAGTG